MEPKTIERPFRCDCVKYARAIKRKIYEETKYMTSEEQREYFRKGSEEFRKAIQKRRQELAESKK